MPIRLSGMNSGLDTDAVVKALVTGYSTKKDKLTKQQTKLTWTQDAWKSLNTKVYGLYTNISSLRYSSAYSLKKTTASDPSKVTVSASNSAINGTQTLKINKVAQSAYLTGGKLASGVTTSTTLAELGYTGDSGSINVDMGDGTSKTYTFDSGDTIGTVIDKLKESGLNASLDSNNSRIFVSSKKTGQENDFNLLAADAEGQKILSKLGLATGLTTTVGGEKVDTATGAAYKSYAKYAQSGDTKTNIENAISQYKDALATIDTNKAQLDNLTSTTSYGKAYTALQGFYEGLKTEDGTGITAEDKKMLDTLASLSSGTRDTALLDADGNVYTQTTGRDSKGNNVYGYKNADGDSTYVSKEEIYADTDGNKYRKTASGYMKLDADGNVEKDGDGKEIKYTEDASDLTLSETNYYKLNEVKDYTTKNAEGEVVTVSDRVRSEDVTGEDGVERKQYVYTDDEGKEYFSDTETGEYTYTADDGTKQTITIGTKFEYNPTTAASMDSAAEEYKNLLGKYQLLDEEEKPTAAVSSYISNLATVTAFEKKASEETEEQKADAYSRSNMVDAIHAGYEANGKSGVDAVLSSNAEVIAAKSAENQTQQEFIDANTVLKTAATADDSSAYVADLVKQAEMAKGILAAGDAESVAVKVDGSDSEIILNGAVYTDSSNSFSINGLNITANAVTDGEVTITTATDTQGIYDKIKDFLTEYNSIVKEMNKLYNAASSKGYEPLTDEEKEEMSDSEVEKWETKIKDALLRNDSTLGGVITAMTSAMSKAVEIDGKKYSLSSFGIHTMGYMNSAENEQNSYHIDGDEDDANTSGNKDRLMAAITADPDNVMEFFQKLTSNLYDAIGSKMKSTSLSSIYTIYNDKQMNTQQTEYKTLIAKWESKISEKEEYYYKKFSAMESALSKLNSTQSSLSGYFQ